MTPPLPVLLVLFLCFFAAGYSSAATLTVTKIEDTNDGVCDADCSLREAVAAATSGDTVVFSSLFNSPQTITLTLGQITISKNLTITGTSQDIVAISGNNASRIFLITAGFTINLSGMTFRDGKAVVSSGTAFGGAILVGNSALSISNSTFTNNRAIGSQCSCGSGAAISSSANNTITLSNLIVVGNSSPLGSAIDSAGSIDLRDSTVRQNTGGGVGASTLNVERCMISDNTDQLAAGVGPGHITMVDSIITNNTGGGVESGGSSATMSIERCLISGNSRSPGGGGVDSSGMTIIKNTQITNNTALADFGGGIAADGTLYLINSVVSGNRNTGGSFNEDGGGGIFTYGGNLFVVNSTVSGNTALGNPEVGGGIYVLANGVNTGHLTLINSTVSNNQSRGSGGGIRVDSAGTATIQNTIVAGNNSTGTTQEDVSGAIDSNGTNLISNTVGSSGWIAADLLNVNPMLAPLGNNSGSTLTHALLPGSPAIDAGNNALAVDPLTMLPLETDQRGRARFTGGKIPTVDIGAFEASYSSSPVAVSGRITTYSGRGIERTRIKIDDGKGNISYAQTNPFGYFRFVNLTPGTTYTITVTHKFYLFTSPQSFTADQNRSDLNFITGL